MLSPIVSFIDIPVENKDEDGIAFIYVKASGQTYFTDL